MRGGAEDWDLWFRLLRHGYRFAANENLVGAYRLRQTSMFRDQQTTHVAQAAKLFDAAEMWAELDPALVVGRGAAAPLSRARSAHERARRAAGVIGMEITATGSLEALVDHGGIRAPRPRGAHRCPQDRDRRGSSRRRMPRSRPVRARSPTSCRTPARDKLRRIGRAVAEAIFESAV